jgi:hypothetical protein
LKPGIKFQVDATVLWPRMRILFHVVVMHKAADLILLDLFLQMKKSDHGRRSRILTLEDLARGRMEFIDNKIPL